jgi:hypothetical protein
MTALYEHGHLAPALELRYPNALPAQLAGLNKLIAAAHPGQLDWLTIQAVLAPAEPTRALRTVLARRTDDPEIQARIIEWGAE